MLFFRNTSFLVIFCLCVFLGFLCFYSWLYCVPWPINRVPKFFSPVLGTQMMNYPSTGVAFCTFPHRVMILSVVMCKAFPQISSIFSDGFKYWCAFSSWAYFCISVIKLKKCSFPSCAYNNVEKQKIALTVELLLVQMFV